MAKTNWHNKGQEDASKGVYHTPHGDLVGLTSTNIKKDTEDIRQYNEGHRRTRKQILSR